MLACGRTTANPPGTRQLNSRYESVSAAPLVSTGRSRWTWWLIRLSRRIWFRAAGFALFAVAGALAAALLGPFLPRGILGELTANDVADVLEILASGMLVVATFSLATMIAAYSAASSSTTPRVTELLLEDASAQNALSTFVGGFLFALVGIIGLNAGLYGDNGHVVLFGLTLVVVAIIVVTFLRWVETLSHFGRVPDAISRTARAAERAMSDRMREPWLGGCRLEGVTSAAGEVRTEKMGYVRNIDMATLQELADEARGEVYVLSPPGTFMDGTRPLAAITGDAGEALRKRLCLAFDIGDTRTFDQDPNYGVSALAEIAVKALSPAICDPKTAVAVIDRLIKVLAVCAGPPAPDAPRCDRVFVPPLDLNELFADAFAEIALYGASDVQVGIRLQQAFLTVSRIGTPEMRAAVNEQSCVALERARAALTLTRDVQRLEGFAAEILSSEEALPPTERSACGAEARR